MAIEKAAVIFQYKLDRLVQVYENDDELTTLLKSEGLYLPDEEVGVPLPARISQYEEILTVFVENSETVSDDVITGLLENTLLRSEIDGIFTQSVDPITDEVFRQLLFSFKYGTIKSFFKDNYTNFMPSYDALVINDNAKLKIWQEAFMQEFDRFAQIIDNIKDINNIDNVAEEYLDYIAQLVGFERGDTSLGDSLFREITKNIIEVYRIKGTNYSFELFFNFIGFEIDVIEYWFDKRYYLSGNAINPYTKETSKYKFAFYLTPDKPTDVVPENMAAPFSVNEDSITDIRNGLTFDRDMGTTPADLERYLNVTGTPDADMDYTYFKTNVVEYSISKITNSEIPEGLTKEDEATIQSYTNFLTPIFVSKKVVINITPFEDDGSVVLLLKDDNIGSESMFIAEIFGELIHKIGFDYYTDYEEKELWGLDYIDSMVSSYIQELNIWSSGHLNWDDLKDIQLEPMYNGIEETLSAYNITYNENKPPATDFILESSADNLIVDQQFLSDIMYMTSKTTHYIASGSGITFADDITTRVGLISEIINGIVFSGSGADSKIYITSSAGGNIDAAGIADIRIDMTPSVGGNIDAAGIAITKLGFDYAGSGSAITSGAAVITIDMASSVGGTATSSGVADTRWVDGS